MPFEQARHACSAIGMRLCSIQELYEDEARGSGCQLDIQRVWSSSSSGCPAGSVLTRAGSSYVTWLEEECSLFESQLGTRCCADEFSELPGNSVDSIAGATFLFDEAELSSLFPKQLEFNPCADDPCSSKENPANVCIGEAKATAFGCYYTRHESRGQAKYADQLLRGSS